MHNGDAENVRGGPLVPCSRDPETGFQRDGYCRHVRRDPGRHEVCAVVTAAFLEFSKAQGNDLVTPRPELKFRGLEPGKFSSGRGVMRSFPWAFENSRNAAVMTAHTSWRPGSRRTCRQ